MPSPDEISRLNPDTATRITALRDTAKWLVGGVAAAAAGIIAASSLTKFGVLAPSDDRFWIAVGGAAAGFAFLAVIVALTLRFMTPEQFTFRDLIKEPLIRDYRKEWEQRSFGGDNLEDVIDKVEEFWISRQNKTNEEQEKYIQAINDLKQAHGVFALYYVRKQFLRLWRNVGFATIFVNLGFGAFAWAANPPSSKAESAFDLENRIESARIEMLMRASNLDTAVQRVGAEVSHMNQRIDRGIYRLRDIMEAVQTARSEGLAKADALDVAVGDMSTELNDLAGNVEAGSRVSEQTLTAIQSVFGELKALESEIQEFVTSSKEGNTVALGALSRIEMALSGLKLALSTLEVDMRKSSDQIARERRWQ